jgi:Delta24(24(1))-sterol reductase
VYTGNFVFQLFLAWVMPGYMQEGLPVPSLGYKTLMYNCNALLSLWATMITAAALHTTGVFRLTALIDNFGHLMSVAMIYGFAVSFGMYFIAVATGTQIRMSGSFIYDVFMGASLNPRIGPIDLKMWAEVRIPWIIVFFMAVSGACKQYESYGYVTPVRIFSPIILPVLTQPSEHGIHGACDLVVHQCLVCSVLFIDNTLVTNVYF